MAPTAGVVAARTAAAARRPPPPADAADANDGKTAEQDTDQDAPRPAKLGAKRGNLDGVAINGIIQLLLSDASRRRRPVLQCL
ncbi:MAG: hypothetical protein HYV78_00990 [Candidatus Wildermuthbacteria bacterium]|nr:hypothetical protein [Candidatus Wildermuthbacteria bacterium]